MSETAHARRVVQAEPDCSRGADEFWTRARETIAWCRARVDPSDPANCLRPASLRPRILEASYFAAVRSVAAERQRECRELAPSHATPAGRWLVYFPDAELSDGAAELESHGFFDVHNAPPHGTWAGIFRDAAEPGDSFAVYLVAWVPSELVAHAQRGIDVNPEECIAWLDSVNVGLRALVPGR